MLFDTQRHNPITGDTQLSPASFGLSMKDVDAAGSLNLKSALNSGGLSLTADHYRELQQIQEKKYGALDATSGILSGPLIPKVDMTGKNPGLYATQSHLGYWDGNKWVSYIGNNGSFQFKGNDDNYIQWNPLTSTLEIKGALQMGDNNLSAEEYIDNLKTEIDKEIKKVDKKIDSKTFDFNLHDAEKQSDGKYKLFLNSQNLRAFTLPPRYSGVYMSRDGLYAYNNGNATFELNANTGNALFRGKVYASGGEFTGSITSTAKIKGGTLEGSNMYGIFATKNRNENDNYLKSRVEIIDTSISLYRDGVEYPGMIITGSSILYNKMNFNTSDDYLIMPNGNFKTFPELRFQGGIYPTIMRIYAGNFYIFAEKNGHFDFYTILDVVNYMIEKAKFGENNNIIPPPPTPPSNIEKDRFLNNNYLLLNNVRNQVQATAISNRMQVAAREIESRSWTGQEKQWAYDYVLN